MLPEIITDIDANYSLDTVNKIWSAAGPGLPGSPQENALAGITEKEMESNLGKDNVTVEEFITAAGAFLSSYPVCGILILFTATLNITIVHNMGISPWLTSVAALAFSIMVHL
jgi:hypothetical protein